MDKIMKNFYFEEIYKSFDMIEEDKLLFDRIIKTPTQRRENILSDIDSLAKRLGLGCALIALYRQQVNTGFVLTDPLKSDGKEKKIHDENTGIIFHLQWNPNRELRKDHRLLIERGVIAENIDKTVLVNLDKNGKACYLCKDNIDIQNPTEVLLEVDLVREKYYIGANFAYITNNHFTIMNAEHRPQLYRKKVLDALIDFIDLTDGIFRTLSNGLAGASIEEHEHLQATTERFPIEDIMIEKQYILYETVDIKISRPEYYVFTLLIEGKNKRKVIKAADMIITVWHHMDEQNHTENIICVKKSALYRIFIIIRDKRKLVGKGKKGDMSAFDASGNIVLSYESNDDGETNEKETFDEANLEAIKLMLKEISPSDLAIERFKQAIIRYIVNI